MTSTHDEKGIVDCLDPEITDRLTSRREALAKTGRWGLGMALASVPLSLGVLVRDVYGQEGLPQDVVDILNFALTLEFLEAEFYERGVMDNPDLIPSEDQPIFDQIRIHENAHVQLLQSVLGDQARSRPEFDFTAGGNFDPFNDYGQFQALAQAFEDTGVRAYKGQAPGLSGAPDVLDTALRIHSVEARHASEVRALRDVSRWIEFAENDTGVAAADAVYAGEDETVHLGVDVIGVTDVSEEAITEAWDEPLSMDDVNAIAGMFIVNG